MALKCDGDDYQFLGVHVRFGSLLGCLQIIFLQNHLAFP